MNSIPSQPPGLSQAQQAGPATQLFYRRGHTILEEGRHPEAVLTLVSGVIRLVRTTRFGRAATVAVAHRGQVFDLPATLSGTAADTTVIADTGCQVAAQPTHAFLAQVDAQLIDLPTWLVRMQGQLVTLERYRGPERIEQRLAALIADLTLARGTPMADLGMSRVAMADLLQVRLESLSRAFKNLAVMDAVATHGRSVRVLDGKKLAAQAAGYTEARRTSRCGSQGRRSRPPGA